MSLADELAEAGADAEDQLTGRALILRHASEQSGGGGERDSWTPDAPDAWIPCAIAPIGSGEDNSASDQLDERTTHILSLPRGSAIADKDRAEVEDVGVFEVTAIRLRSLEVTRRVEVIEAPSQEVP